MTAYYAEIDPRGNSSPGCFCLEMTHLGWSGANSRMDQTAFITGMSSDNQTQKALQECDAAPKLLRHIKTSPKLDTSDAHLITNPLWPLMGWLINFRWSTWRVSTTDKNVPFPLLQRKARNQPKAKVSRERAEKRCVQMTPLSCRRSNFKTNAPKCLIIIANWLGSLHPRPNPAVSAWQTLLSATNTALTWTLGSGCWWILKHVTIPPGMTRLWGRACCLLLLTNVSRALANKDKNTRKMWANTRRLLRFYTYVNW